MKSQCNLYSKIKKRMHRDFLKAALIKNKHTVLNHSRICQKAVCLSQNVCLRELYDTASYCSQASYRLCGHSGRPFHRTEYTIEMASPNVVLMSFLLIQAVLYHVYGICF